MAIEQAIFQRTELLIGDEAMKRLSSKRVIIFGVGGVGSWCAESLIRSGIRLKQYDASSKIPIDYKGTEYEEIDKATLNKQYVRYYADPVGFVSNNPNVKVIVKDEHGNPTKINGIPYNPIER